MTKRKVNQTRDPLRRESILKAALATFKKHGYAETTLAMICKESGSSVGSVYHFFRGKSEIALELVREATKGWSTASGGAATTPADPESAVKASVRGLLLWANADEDLFHFMEEMRARSQTDREFQDLRQFFASGQIKARELYRDWIKQGAVKDMRWELAYSLMMGPPYLYLRTKPPGKKIPHRDIQVIVEASWNMIKKE